MNFGQFWQFLKIGIQAILNSSVLNKVHKRKNKEQSGLFYHIHVTVIDTATSLRHVVLN